MKIHYYRSAHGNFGDDLNAWLWRDLVSGPWEEDSRHLFLGIGTIIGNPLPDHARVTVFSSGVGYSNLDNLGAYRDLDIVSVRGPLSAAALGLPPEKAIADGALLLPHSPRLGTAPARTERTIFIPHHESMEDTGLVRAAAIAGLEIVDPRQDAEVVIHAIRSARLVVAESMHAAIIADTFDTPWVPVATTTGVSSFKWWDWLSTVKLPFEPQVIRSTSAGHWITDRLRRYHGEDYFGAGPSIDQARTAYQDVIRFRRKPGWEGVRDWRKRQAGRLARLGRMPGVQSFDRQRTEGAARDLQVAASHAGYLSAPVVRRSLGEHLLDKLTRLARENGGGPR